MRIPKINTLNNKIKFLTYSLEELLQESLENLKNLSKERLKITAPHIIASFLERIDVNERRIVLSKLSVEEASEVLSEMNAEDSAEVIAVMREWRALKILEEFDPDDATDLMYQLKLNDRTRILNKLSKKMAKDVRKLLTYHPNTGGGIMTPYFIYVHPEMLVKEAINHIRKLRDEFDHTSYVYAIETDGKLKGVMTLRSLIMAKPEQKILDIMHQEIQGICHPFEDSEKIALKMAELNFQALPIVDNEGHIIGIVEHDDIIDILQNEATEDFQKIVGAGPNETIHDTIMFSVKHRFPWLLVNLLTASTASWVVSFYQESIKTLPILAVFIPLMASLGGNTGSQTLAISIRSIALGQVQTSDNLKIFISESLKGLVNGLFIGIIGGFCAFLISRDIFLSIVIFASLMLTMFIAGSIGAIVPLLLKYLNLDPAQSSSIFLTAINDTCSSLIFLSIGTVVLVN